MLADTLKKVRGVPGRALRKFERDVLGRLPRERHQKILHHIDPARPGLEIGPSHRPTLTKAKGHNVKILDHATQDELREKYRTHGVDIAAIEAVDYVWNGERYRDLVGPKTRFDWIIA
jgi:hypothetical protein